MNIVITGASRGIGFEVARKFASNGKHTIISIARNTNGLYNLKELCSKTESQLVTIAFDLKHTDKYKTELLPLISNQVKQVDILINNVGYLINKPFGKLTIPEIEDMTTVNFISAATLIQTLLPLMAKGSHVVSISSMGGFQGSQKFPGLSIYSSTKAALASLTECLAEEYKENGIAFNCLALGATNTEMFREAFPGFSAPLKAEEMANFIVDFALKGNKYFNGKILPVSSTTP